MAEQTTLPTNSVKIEMVNLPNGNSNGEIVANNVGVNKEIDLNFLPLVYEIIKSIEKEPTQESSGKSRDTQDTSTKIFELEKKLNEAKQQILLLPGIEHSKEEQLRKLEVCRTQVSLKQQLISKYRSLNSFPLAE